MSTLTICLFGRLSIRSNAQSVVGLDSRKVQELLCYLLLHRDRAHSREILTGLLWSDGNPTLSKAYLRKPLWKLNSSLNAPGPQRSILLFDEDWVQINADADLWLDVAVFERAYAAAQGVWGHDLGLTRAESLQEAV